MRILTTAGEFIMPVNFETTITKYNVLLNSAGEQTIPFTLPPDPVNLKLIGWSNRIDAAYKPLVDITVTVVFNSTIRSANLSINSADEQDGISCTLYMGTGDFYSRIDDVKIASLAWPIIKSPSYDTETLEQRVDYLINYLKNFDSLSNFIVCPVATTTRIKYNDASNTYDETIILNWFEERKCIQPLEDGTYYLRTYKGEFEQTVIEDSVYVNLTKGYGMTPFLKLLYVLDVVFSSYNYSFLSNDLKESIQETDGMFIINNVVDSIYAGVLVYSQLLPDMTIKAFLSEIERWFCGKFIINETTKQCYFLPFRGVDMLQGVDISPYMSSSLKLVDSKSEKIVLNLNNSYKKNNAEKVTVLDFNFPVPQLISREFNTGGAQDGDEYGAPPTPDYYLPVRFWSIEIDEVIHKNSAIEIGGVTGTVGDKTMTKLLLAYSDDLYDGAITVDPNSYSTLYLKRSYALFGRYDELERINYFYDKYIEFKLNSNFQIEGTTNMPAHVIDALSLEVPVIVNGQKCLIEKIDYQTSSKNTENKKITLRTLRSYQVRP